MGAYASLPVFGLEYWLYRRSRTLATRGDSRLPFFVVNFRGPIAQLVRAHP